MEVKGITETMILTSLLLLQAILSHKLKSNVSCISLKLERKGITETIIPLSLHCRDTKSQNEFNNSFCDINVPKCINRIHIHAMAYRQCRRGFLGLWFATRGFFLQKSCTFDQESHIVNFSKPLQWHFERTWEGLYLLSEALWHWSVVT